ncbi:hypothetical protein NB689_002925 [Xanthomonas sacchari]|nr:hypothetical protein [Xanthomonas sacchari]
MQLPAGLVGTDRGPLRQQHRAGIQARFHLHQAHPGLAVAGLDRALDRRGAAPTRQQRGMHVPAAMGRDRQHRLGQDQPVGHHHDQVRLQRAQRLQGFRRAQRLRLQHRDAARHRFQLDRRRGQPAAAPGGPVRLGVDRDHFMALRSRAQRRHGEVRRTGEDEFHGGWEPGMGNGEWEKREPGKATGTALTIPVSPFPVPRFKPRACAPWPASCAPFRA